MVNLNSYSVRKAGNDLPPVGYDVYAGFGMIIGIGLIFVGIFVRVEVYYNLLVILGVITLPIAMALGFALPAFRSKSPGYIDELHHSSLETKGPIYEAVQHLPNGRNITWGIFPLGGVDWGWIHFKGGGSHGYVICPRGGYIVTGASTHVFYGLRRATFNQVPYPVQEGLLRHGGFRVKSSPIWMAYLPPTIENMAKILSIYDPRTRAQAEKDIVEYNKMLEQLVKDSDFARQNISKRSTEVSRQAGKKSRFTPIKEEYKEVSNEGENQ